MNKQNNSINNIELNKILEVSKSMQNLSQELIPELNSIQEQRLAKEEKYSKEAQQLEVEVPTFTEKFLIFFFEIIVYDYSKPK